MIYLEIIKSSDPLAMGLYEYEFDQITIGRSKKSDLIFLESELPLHFLTIKFMHQHLVIQSLSRSPYFFVNGKKISGMLKLKPQDIIAFGENQIRIIKTSPSLPETDLSSAYKEFNKKSPELRFALDFIEEVLLQLEKDTHV
jgi:hypothetical protein